MRLLHACAVCCLLGVSLASTPGRAQPAPLPAGVTDAMTQKARELYLDGVKAYKQSRWADARASFLAALALAKHYTIAGNLGDCELRLGLYRDAAEHLARYVREMEKDKTSTPQERADGAARYAEARAKVGEADTQVDVPGAEVFVDGKLAGTAPLEDPIFLDPGSHVIEARSEGLPSARATVEAKPGVAVPVNLALRKADGTKPPAGPDKRLLIAGGAVAGAGIVLGAVFAGVSNAKASTAASKYDALVSTGGSRACMSAAPAAGCADLAGVLQDRATFAGASVTAFVGAGAVGAATAVYALVASRPAANPGLRVAPAVTGRGAGLTVQGTW